MVGKLRMPGLSSWQEVNLVPINVSYKRPKRSAAEDKLTGCFWLPRHESLKLAAGLMKVFQGGHYVFGRYAPNLLLW